MANWSDLPTELLYLISTFLTIPDLLRFEAVCHLWRSVILDRRRRHHPPPPNQSPWLMFYAPRGMRRAHPTAASFYSLSDGKVHKIYLPKPAEIGRGMWIGSAHGWLVIADRRSDLSLLNPISRQQIQLPAVATFSHIETIRNSQGQIIQYLVDPRHGPPWRLTAENLLFYLYAKVVLLSNPSTEDYIVAVLLGLPHKGFAFAKAGDLKWTLIDTPAGYTDIVHHKGQLYTARGNGAVDSWDLSESSPKPTVVVPEPKQKPSYHYFYLVSAPWGDLLHVMREKCELEETLEFSTFQITVSKVDFETMNLKEMDTLGDYVLFLGSNLSTCLSSINVPGLKGNCIYITDEHWDFCGLHKDVQRDVGIYDVKYGSTRRILPSQVISNWPPPVWVTPSLT